MKKVHFSEWGIESPKYWGILAILGVFVAIAGAAVFYMEHEGHWVTGMTNQIVWGMPHVFAIFLIVAASGALNVASIGTVFEKGLYKPLGRLSGLLAITLLMGGLAVLVLDLGKPDRLLVAMTHYNFKSIFAWNIFLYTGFMAVVALYLWFMMDRRMNKYYRPTGVVAFVWRIILTTGTGSIFGFIVARQGYDAAIYAPMFVIMSFAYGLAIYILVLLFVSKLDGREVGDKVLFRMKNLLGVFAASVFYFTVVLHIATLYATEIVIGGQAFPMAMFPGKTIVASGFFDGVNGQPFLYSPTLAETALGVGGVALVLLLTFVAIRVLQFLPTSLADEAVDPHHVKS